MATNWIQVAAKTARHSELDFKLGAVITKGSSVISTGFNKRRNEVEVVGNLEDCHVHAEVDAISGAADDQLQGAVLYVARVNSDGSIRNAQPCWRCIDAIKDAGIKKVVWSNDPKEGKGSCTSMKMNRVDIPDMNDVHSPTELAARFVSSTIREVAYSWFSYVPKGAVTFTAL